MKYPAVSSTDAAIAQGLSNLCTIMQLNNLIAGHFDPKVTDKSTECFIMHCCTAPNSHSDSRTLRKQSMVKGLGS